MSLFEEAARSKVRFATSKGMLSVEDLWDLPLTSRSSISLDLIAMNLSKRVKDSSEESFVVKVSKPNEGLKLQLNIVVRIIEVKLAERDAAKTASEKKIKKQKLLELLAKKQDDAMEGLSEADILKQLEEL